MHYPDINEYITFLFSMLDAFSIPKETSPKEGDPKLIRMLRSPSFTPLWLSNGSRLCAHSRLICFIISSTFKDVNSRHVRHT